MEREMKGEGKRKGERSVIELRTLTTILASAFITVFFLSFHSLRLCSRGES